MYVKFQLSSSNSFRDMTGSVIYPSGGSCVGPGVRTSPLFGSVRVHMYLDPPLLPPCSGCREAVAYVLLQVMLYNYPNHQVVYGTILRASSLHVLSLRWVTGWFQVTFALHKHQTAVGAAAVPHLAVYAPVAAVTVIWRWASAFAGDGH